MSLLNAAVRVIGIMLSLWLAAKIGSIFTFLIIGAVVTFLYTKSGDSEK